MSNKMRAMAIKGYGKNSPLVEMEFPIPDVKEHDVLIEIHAASVNPIDFKIRNGDVRLLMSSPMPFILGNDLSGVVKQVGGQVTKFRVGDKVYTRPPHDRSGTFAEFIAVNEDHVAPMPKGMSFEDAASIPLVGLTAYQALHDCLHAKQGDKVLIHAGAGGFGTFAIQLAKQMGLYVATTASEKGHDLVKSLGADEIVNYRTEKFEEKLHDYDGVIDTIGGNTLLNSFKVVKKGHKVVSISAIPDGEFGRKHRLGFVVTSLLRLASARIVYNASCQGAVYEFLLMQENGSQLREITKLVEDGKIKPVIDRVYSFEEAQQALHYVESGRAKGKVVIKVHPN
ncbi:nadph:quinone reductase [Malassezia pachydermatis]|uniref:Nadph:quinone reductase n=1 Tax=Malassezia pachydermatis TaxID=77020 RepID=A0A0M8MML2_9BASI|nr:nadph:quinone reductase [Malassezia pachydermatis]KOS13157.1 nadph:quinone reductase [Malassezia pachydermatis]